MIMVRSWGQLSIYLGFMKRSLNVQCLFPKKFQSNTIAEVKSFDNKYHICITYTNNAMNSSVSSRPTTETIKNLMNCFLTLLLLFWKVQYLLRTKLLMTANINEKAV